ncbi:phosphotransferase [Saccharothrix texasensis]|uniref:phosphotransferase n=1 Tax=Saccharothrix texasensis TaxID=103734 RepID=UPI001FE399D2|nr:phosphotransferase [Saccharothrix texasensis]
MGDLRFGHTWTIARWVEGEPADRAPITGADAPTNPTRGIPLAGVGDWFELIADHPGADRAREVWERAVAAPAWSGPPLWLHGDPHPANVVVRDGTLAGVVDFGELCCAPWA